MIKDSTKDTLAGMLRLYSPLALKAPAESSDTKKLVYGLTNMCKAPAIAAGLTCVAAYAMFPDLPMLDAVQQMLHKVPESTLFSGPAKYMVYAGLLTAWNFCVGAADIMSVGESPRQRNLESTVHTNYGA